MAVGYNAGDRAVGPGAPNIQIFTAGGTWTKPAGLRAAIVMVAGGGGGGGGVDETTTVPSQAEAGYGGAGGYSWKLYQATDLSTNETVTVGAAGTGAAAGQNTGGTGGTSAFKTQSCAGGVGGLGAGVTNGTVYIAGGAGGTASGGDINIAGESGGAGRTFTGVSMLLSRGGGTGGGLGLGGGPRTVSGTGNAGVGYGGGGGGAFGAGQASPVDRAGGAGATGVVIVLTYF